MRSYAGWRFGSRGLVDAWLGVDWVVAFWGSLRWWDGLIVTFVLVWYGCSVWWMVMRGRYGDLSFILRGFYPDRLLRLTSMRVVGRLSL